MKKSKLIIANIRNSIDFDGRAVGHAVKSMHEAIAMLKDDFEVIIAVSEKLFQYFINVKKFKLTYSEIYGDGSSNYKTFLKDFKNSWHLIHSFKKEKIWFILTSEAVFWAIALSKKGKRKYIITTYKDFNLSINSIRKFKKIREWFFLKALDKIDLGIVTNKNFQLGIKTAYIPDYYRTNEQKILAALPKEKRIVCVGQMRKSRDLDGLVQTFAGRDIEVLIIGQFSDKNWFEELKKEAGRNIRIEDRLLDMKEYNKLLSSSKYSILPYDMKIYQGRTSGVLLESVFWGCIPIAPKELLDYNGLQGIGYKKIRDVPELLRNENNVICNNLEQYDYEIVKTKLLALVEGMENENN